MQRKFTRQQLRAIYFKNFGRFPEQSRNQQEKKEEMLHDGKHIDRVDKNGNKF